MESQVHELGAGDAPASRYREFAPPPALARALVCSWTQIIGDGPSSYAQRVLPDGCVDLVWLGDQPPSAVGPSTAPFVARLRPRTEVVGIRFRPGWAPSIIGAPASELLDRNVALVDLWGRAADALADPVLERPSPAARLAAIEEVLRARWLRARPADPMITAAVAWLARHPSARVDRLAAELRVSPRHLHRRFAEAVGYGPKTFQRVARFQRLLGLGAGARRAGDGLSQLALDAGYADQAHMTREVRRLAGRTPAAMVGVAGTTLALSDLFKTESDGRGALEP